MVTFGGKFHGMSELALLERFINTLEVDTVADAVGTPGQLAGWIKAEGLGEVADRGELLRLGFAGRSAQRLVREHRGEVDERLEDLANSVSMREPRSSAVVPRRRTAHVGTRPPRPVR